MPNTSYEQLKTRLQNREITLGVIGLGYVGLPLAITAARRGINTIGFDIDPRKMALLDAGTTYIEAVSAEALREVASQKSFSWTADFSQIKDCDVIVICVPTPLTQYRDPDLSFVENTTREIAKHLRAGALVSLESTTYPGTTVELVIPILETSGLQAGKDFFVGFSPEREDPGNATFRTATIPKVVSGDGPLAGELATMFYAMVVDKVVTVASTQVAEAVKITENIFRAVNIALVNELKVIFDAMGIDVWDVIDGAATKPFGYMPFYPGPGLGGHCIPIDPYYLSWKAKEYGLNTRFIELAGEINVAMPRYVISRLREVLDQAHGKGLRGTRILLIGVSYKKNISDMRESPSVELLEMLLEQGADAKFHDPLVEHLPRMRNYPKLEGMASVPFDQVKAEDFDAVLIATDHDTVDYGYLAGLGVPIVDTRNVMARKGLPMDNVTKA